ncbi:hypothetical protein PFISCL1PPCAC_18113 [Pristionchus fissidentatus]|uniref:ANTAR domain-containing protein n=1 Tax=Pristionchus fissidentatus TaxID=1538716 RepID=A0AAV5W4S6_9BILA|nr:hypothetical protein PFISCL1PPCAC_18113 [Pristionchus fissidentatus]
MNRPSYGRGPSSSGQTGISDNTMGAIRRLAVNLGLSLTEAQLTALVMAIEAGADPVKLCQAIATGQRRVGGVGSSSHAV